MRIVLHIPDGNRWIGKTSLFTRPGEWPLMGLSLREILSMEYEVSYLSSELYLGIPEKRMGVKVVSELDLDAIYLPETIVGPPSSIYSLIRSLSSYDGALLTYRGEKVGWIGGDAQVTVELEAYGIDMIRYPWDLIYFLDKHLKRILDELPELLGLDEFLEGVYVGKSVDVEEPVVLDTRKGNIVVMDDAGVEAFTVLRGPVYIGRSTYLLSPKVSNSIVGDVVKVGCEVDSSVIMGYSNAAHHGYIGHSVVGYWVNIGAGTVFSDLKNTYGSTRFWIDDGNRVDTGMLKLGSYIGDYAKTGILTSIYGGSLIGFSSHVLRHFHGYLDPLRIYDGLEGRLDTLDIEKAMEIARRMYRRRGVEWMEGEELLWRRRAELL